MARVRQTRQPGRLDKHKQELWKAPLPQFIEHLYGKRFGRERPDVVRPIEQIAPAAKRARMDRGTPGSRRESAVEKSGE
jgi:hypothetical protein